jgi:hypothetical protein
LRCKILATQLEAGCPGAGGVTLRKIVLGAFWSKVVRATAETLADAGLMHVAEIILRAIPGAKERRKAEAALRRARGADKDALEKHKPGKSRHFARRVRILTQQGRFAEAIQLVPSITDKWDRILALADIATGAIEAGHNRAPDVFEEVIQAVQHEVNGTEPKSEEWASAANVLHKVESEGTNWARKLIADGRFDSAEKVVASIPDAWQRLLALRDVATAAAQAGHSRAANIFERVTEAVSGNINQREHIAAIRAAALALGRAGSPHAKSLFDIGREEILALPDRPEQDSELSELTRAMCEARMFDDARLIADTISEEARRQYALASVVSGLSRNGRRAEARRLARRMRRQSGDDGAHRWIVNALVDAGYTDEARELARAARAMPDREYVSAELPALLVRQNLFDIAREELEAIQNSRARVRALTAYGVELAKSNSTQGRSTLKEAEHLARRGRKTTLDTAVSWVSIAYAEAGWFDDAAKLIRTVDFHSDATRVELTKKLNVLRGATLVRSGQIPDALQNLGKLDVDLLVQAIADWAPAFDEFKNSLSVMSLVAVIDVAGWIRTDWRRIHGLVMVDLADSPVPDGTRKLGQKENNETSEIGPNQK